MECPYCKISWEGDDRQYCPSCGKLVSIFVRKPSPPIISLEQIVWIIVAGFSSYFVLLYIVGKVNLTFSVVVYLGLDASLIMSYRVFELFKKTENESINDFFPYYKEFFIIVGILIWFSALWIKIVFDYVLVSKTIDYYALGRFTVDYTEGYILGLLIMVYFYYRYRKEKEVKNVKVIDLLPEEETNF